MTTRYLLIVLLILTPCPAIAGISSDVISFTGIGPIQVGMSPAQAADIIGEELIEGPSGTEGCHHVHPRNQPGIRFMIENNRITRVETGDARYQTAGGIRVGDPEEKVNQVYRKKAEITKHHYNDQGHYFTLRSKDNKQALVIETAGSIYKI